MTEAEKPIRGTWAGSRFRYVCTCCQLEYVQDVSEINPPSVCHTCYSGNRKNRMAPKAYSGRTQRNTASPGSPMRNRRH